MATRNAAMLLAGLVIGWLLAGVPTPDDLHAQKRYTRLSTPRIAPVDAVDFTAEQKAAVGDNTRPNTNLRTALYEPEFGKRWWSWLTFVWNSENRVGSALTLYDKELVILRVNYLCHDDWVWGQHVPIAKRNGRSDEDIARIPAGPAAPGWSERDRLLMKAVQELHDDYFVSDPTWAGLARLYNTKQLIDLIFTVGNYHLNAMYTNTVGMPLEKGFSGIPQR